MNVEEESRKLAKRQDKIETMTQEEMLLQLAETGMSHILPVIISEDSDDVDIALIAKTLKHLSLLQDYDEITFHDLDALSPADRQRLVEACAEISSMLIVGAMEYAMNSSLPEEHTLADALEGHFFCRDRILRHNTRIPA